MKPWRQDIPEMTDLDSSRRAQRNAMNWFKLYPEWTDRAACLARKHRNEKAWVVCHGQIVGKQTPDFELLLGEDRFSGRYGGFECSCSCS